MKFLKIDNPVMVFLTRVFDLAVLNILFLICCIPLFTIGDAITSLYSVTLKMVKNEEAYIVRSYVKALKENFAQSTAVWVLIVIMGSLLYTDFQIILHDGMTQWWFLRYPLLLAAVLLLCVFIYSFPIMAYFHCTLKRVFQNALLMSLAHLPYTLLFMGCIVAAAVFAVNGDVRRICAMAGIFAVIGFAVCGYFNSFLFHKIFGCYSGDS